MAAACFLGCTAMVQLLIQLECACVCLGEGTQRAIRGCEEAVSRVTRLTAGTAWNEPFPWDGTAITEFMLTIQVLTSQWNPNFTSGLILTYAWKRKNNTHYKKGTSANTFYCWRDHTAVVYTCLYLCFDYAHNDPPISTSHNFMPIKYFILTSLPVCSVSEQWNTRRFRAIKPNEMNYTWSETRVHWHFYSSPGIIYRAATPGMEWWKMDQS